VDVDAEDGLVECPRSWAHWGKQGTARPKTHCGQ
jgi:hypothetical protein